MFYNTLSARDFHEHIKIREGEMYLRCHRPLYRDYPSMLMIKFSGIHGKGVFARVDIPPNTEFEYRGERMPDDAFYDRYCRFPELPNSTKFGFFVSPRYAVDCGRGHHIDAADRSLANEIRYINHRSAAKANCKLVVRQHGERVVVVTKKTIRRESELTMPYGPGFRATRKLFQRTIADDRTLQEYYDTKRRQRRRAVKSKRRALRAFLHQLNDQELQEERYEARASGEVAVSPQELPIDYGSDAETPESGSEEETLARPAAVDKAAYGGGPKPRSGKYYNIGWTTDTDIDDEACSASRQIRRCELTLANLRRCAGPDEIAEALTAIAGVSSRNPEASAAASAATPARYADLPLPMSREDSDASDSGAAAGATGERATVTAATAGATAAVTAAAAASAAAAHAGAQFEHTKAPSPSMIPQPPRCACLPRPLLH